MGFNAQTVLESLGIPVGTTIALPYGLMLEISMVDNANELCTDHNQVQALEGLLGICQGVMMTLSEVELLDLCSVIFIANEYLGVIISYRDRGIIQLAAENGLPSPEDLINAGMEELGINEMIQQVIPGCPVQYIPFEELVPLWWKIVNSKLIYVIRENYQSTSYSLATGLDALLG